jgi:hypothetical protein
MKVEKKLNLGEKCAINGFGFFIFLSLTSALALAFGPGKPTKSEIAIEGCRVVIGPVTDENQGNSDDWIAPPAVRAVATQQLLNPTLDQLGYLSEPQATKPPSDTYWIDVISASCQSYSQLFNGTGLSCDVVVQLGSGFGVTPTIVKSVSQNQKCPGLDGILVVDGVYNNCEHQAIIAAAQTLPNCVFHAAATSSK